MRSFLEIFTRLQGRLKRSQFWLGAVVLLAADIALSVLASQLGFAVKHTATVVSTVDGGSQSTQYLTSWSVGPVAVLVISIVVLPFAIIVSRKRRHDRGNSGIDATLILLAGILLQVLAVTGVDGALVQLLGLVYAVGLVYLLVVAGFLPGTPGSNQYGTPR